MEWKEGLPWGLWASCGGGRPQDCNRLADGECQPELVGSNPPSPWESLGLQSLWF